MADQSLPSKEEVLDHFFRNEYGKIIAHLTRTYGSTYIELIEDAVQEALIKAMNTWAFNAIPDNPSGWIFRTAKNQLIDQLRRNAKLNKGDQVLEIIAAEEQNRSFMKDVVLDSELKDDQLRMIFACCHPVLSPESQLILTLKLMGGFSKKEIAKALLKKEDAVAKSFTRARKKFADEVGELVVPMGRELESRLDNVMKVIYLLFNEGYASSSGDALLRYDLCEEAIRLCALLEENKHCASPEVFALQALMMFHSARFEGRTDEDGEFLSLADQDRQKWNVQRIEEAIGYLNRASEGNHISEYHIQAGMAYYHSTAPTFSDTSWQSILQLYDLQMRYFPSAVAALNRAVVIHKVEGHAAAIKAVDQIGDQLNNYRLYHAFKGDLLAESQHFDQALKHYQKAIELSDNQKEKNHLQRKIEEMLSSP